MPSAAELVQILGLQPHPEGGFYKETFRDDAAAASGSGRAASTAILYLLPAGAKSKLHRLDASECWHAYMGQWLAGSAAAAAAATPGALMPAWRAKAGTAACIDTPHSACQPSPPGASPLHPPLPRPRAGRLPQAAPSQSWS
jgi:hypothetical protein